MTFADHLLSWDKQSLIVITYIYTNELHELMPHPTNTEMLSDGHDTLLYILAI